MRKQIKRQIYMLSKRHMKPIEVVQYDYGVQLVFEVMDIDLDTSLLNATLFVRKPSGKFVFQEDNISITGNTVTINLENQALTEYGKAFFQIKFKANKTDLSTYSGMLTVEKSLDDSGAEESKTVLAAFDKLTDEEIARIEEATRSQIELMKAEVEAKGETVLSTIPDEYTEMYNRVNTLFNSVANAIKGIVSGSVVRVDDVSPVEHTAKLKVRGKNLFDISNLTTTNVSDKEPYVSEVGENYIVVTTPTDYTGNGFITYSVTLKEICPQLEVGKTYVLNAATESIEGKIFLYGAQFSWVFGAKLTMNEEFLNSKVVFYGLSAVRGQGVGNCTISNIQIEEGTTASEYTPYIDPTTVTVTADGVNYTPEADGTVEGIPSTALSGGISTDNAEITIECEYNKDTNKVIDNLTKAVVALGGVV